MHRLLGIVSRDLFVLLLVRYVVAAVAYPIQGNLFKNEEQA